MRLLRNAFLIALLCAPSAFAQTSSVWLVSSADSGTGTGAAGFFPPIGGGPDRNATENNAFGVMPTGGSISFLDARTLTDPSAAHTLTVMLMVNGSTTALFCDLVGGSGATSCSNHADSVAVIQGDTVSVRIQGTAGSVNGRVPMRLKFTSTITGETVLMGNSAGNVAAAAFGSLQGGGTFDSATGNDSLVNLAVALPGTITRGCIKLVTGTSVAGSRDFFLVKNGTPTAMTVNFVNADGATTKCDSTHTVAVIPTDTLSWQSTITLVPTASKIASSVVFVGTTVGDFLVPANSKKSMAGGTTTEYSPLGDYDGPGTGFPAGTEANHRNSMFADTMFKSLCVVLSAATGGGDSYTFKTRANTLNVLNNFQVTVTDPATSACYLSVSSPTNQYFADNDLANSVITPTGSPVAVRAAITYGATMTLTACASNYILIDHGRGSNGTQVSASLIDGSTFGVAGASALITGAGADLTFATAAHHDLGGTLPTQCNNVWPGNTDSTVGMLVHMDDTTTKKNARYLFPSTVTGDIVANTWFMMPTLPTMPVLPDMFTIFSTNGAHYNNIGVNGDGVTVRFYMESASGGGCVGHGSGSDEIPFTPGVWYHLSLRFPSSAATNYKMTVRDENLNVVGFIGGPGSGLVGCAFAPLSVTWGYDASTDGDTYDAYYDKVIICGAFNEVCPIDDLLITPASGRGSMMLMGVGF